MRSHIYAAVAIFVLLLGLAGCKREAPAPTLPPSAQEYFDAGLRFFGAEQYPQAQANFEAAAAAGPGMVEAHFYLGLCYARQNMPLRAEGAFLAALRLAPNHVMAREALGVLYYSMGDYSRSKRELEQARALFSTNPQTFFYLGNIYASENDCPAALAAYKRALELDSSYLPARQEMEAAKRRCAKGPAKAAAPAVQKSFTGGAKALDPADF